ncbi:hypothetical protein A2U01_0060080, partial [Trifolium medium]|nr:hypothetical protein [Trifolium medium]
CNRSRRLQVKLADKRVFWNMRVAQGYLARCAGQSSATGFLSGSCAARQVAWRVAPAK